MSRRVGLNRSGGVDVQGMNHDELAWQDVLFKDFEVLVTTAVHGASETVVRLSIRRDAGSCPTCGRASTRVRDRYERRSPDLPLAGHGVRILLSVRRFICVDSACPQRTFAEQITGEPFLAWTGREYRAGRRRGSRPGAPPCRGRPLHALRGHTLSGPLPRYRRPVDGPLDLAWPGEQ
ncbi:transposase family protein [Streptomyces sp. NPDC001601]|uniref:transposase family protein n=1 Tax=Streptomyces sp. NPDC001601 TaxID=3364592 RepID=UPI0036997394